MYFPYKPRRPKKRRIPYTQAAQGKRPPAFYGAFSDEYFSIKPTLPYPWWPQFYADAQPDEAPAAQQPLP